MLCFSPYLQNPSVHPATFTVHHSKDKMQQHYDTARKNSSPAATKIYCASIRLLQVRALPFAFRDVAL